jgi:uncharacterized membrane protein SpoIIM required for sporulation
MTPAHFLQTRKPAWDELESLVRRARAGGLRSLKDNDLHKLTRLYPAVAVDVARARMYKIDSVTQNRINQLAIAAHGLLYRRKSTRYLMPVLAFFTTTYPRLFRRLWRYVALAAAMFFIGAFGAYVSTRLRPANAYIFVPAGLEMPNDEPGVSSSDISERFRQIARPPMAAGIMANNISVAFNCFALGISAGVGTCYLLFFNAMVLGSFFAHFDNHGLSYELWAFISPHGILEIFAILVAAAAGLHMGLSIAIPGRLKRSASLRTGAAEAVLLVLGTIPMFIIAGLIEGFITPSYIPGSVKIGLGLAVWMLVFAYLMLAGRKRAGAQSLI